MDSLWLVGLRRHLVSSEALDRYIAQHGVTGVVWTPDAWPVDDYSRELVSLAEAGARTDWSLLWDLVAVDARAAAESLGHVWHQTNGRDGYVAVWVDPERLGDPGRAAAHAVELVEDVARGNVAIAFAWQPARAGALSSIVAERVAVAVSGADEEAVNRAWQRGMERLRKDDPEADDVPLFLLGANVRLARDVGLLAPDRGLDPRLPVSPEEERAAFRDVLARLAARSKPPAREDAYLPPAFEASVLAAAGRVDVEPVWARDHTVWKPEPEEVADRLGWLDVADRMLRERSDLEAFGQQVRSGGIDHLVLLGMGGSSLAPELFAATLEKAIRVTVLDTTHPDHVASVRDSLVLPRTAFVVASKSGTTVETLAHLELFWSLLPRGDRFVAITDAGTPLGELARERGFRRVFENPPDVGGRFSALSYFGLVPAAITGIDIGALLASAIRMAGRCGPAVPPAENPAARLASALGEAHGRGQDKLTFAMPPAIGSLGDWLEQLVAESTGKDGTGVVPVCGEPLGAPEVYGDDRIFCVYTLGDAPPPAELEAIEAAHPVVRIRLADARSLGGELFRWELAVALLGARLGVNPFDQPDVEAAKRLAQAALLEDAAPVDRGSARETLEGCSYIAIQAFVPPAASQRLALIRTRMRDRYRVATTLGFGPRFLHSTGQLHKGGPAGGAFLQVTDTPATDVQVPGKSYSFGRLIAAQADGDLRALRDAGRAAARVSLEELEDL